MSTKNISTESGNSSTADEFKEQNNKFGASKFEYDLYHEEDDVVEKVVRIKKVSMPNKGEKWKIMIDNKVVFTIESTKISKPERSYLQTVQGFNFMLSQAKSGIKSLNNFRSILKSVLPKEDKRKTRKKK